MSCRRPHGTSHENNRFVIAGVTIAERGAFDAFDPGIVGLGLAGGGAGNDEDFNLFPPSAHGPVELVSSPASRRPQQRP